MNLLNIYFHTFMSITKLDINIKEQFYLTKTASLSRFIKFLTREKITGKMHSRLEYYTNEELKKCLKF